MRTLIIAILCLGSFFGTQFCSAEEGNLFYSDVKVTVRVADGDDKPIAEAQVTFLFEVPNNMGGKNGYVIVTKTTDVDGLASAEHKGGQRVGFRAEAPGYYGIRDYTYDFKKLLEGRWEPYNPTVKIMLREVIKPIPMHVWYGLKTTIPVTDKPVGFDLIKRDWVAPHGKGEVADFVVTAQGIRSRSRSDFEGTFVLEFSNEGDGILPYPMPLNTVSKRLWDRGLILPHEAPEDGYDSKRLWENIRRPTGDRKPDHVENSYREDMNYFFRVRTVLNADGTPREAMYGKIYGDIEFDPRDSYDMKGPTMKLTYFLNPDKHSRNVEFDPDKNLFEDAPKSKHIRIP